MWIGSPHISAVGSRERTEAGSTIAPSLIRCRIARTNEIDLVAGSRFVVEGALTSGEAAIVLQKGSIRVTTVPIAMRSTNISGFAPTLGHFAVVLDVPHTGTYSVEAIAPSSGHIELDITRSAILAPNDSGGPGPK